MTKDDRLEVDSRLWNEWRDALDGEENLEDIKPGRTYEIDQIVERDGSPHLLHFVTDGSGVFRRPYWFKKASLRV